MELSEKQAIATKIIEKMTDSTGDRQRLGTELSVARDIQANMLPRRFPAFPKRHDFNIFATMTPAKEVGGDFYDYFLTDENHLVMVIGDVSGKGVAAALFMSIAKTLIRTYARMGFSPADVLSKTNRDLCHGNSAELFVTVWMAVLSLESGVLTYANAGHNPPLLKQANGQYEYLQCKPCFVLAGFDTVNYVQNAVTMTPGSKLFLYTDGVTEATNADKELYGEDRIKNYLNTCKDEHDLTKILYGAKADIDAFVGNAEQFDDITMVVLDYKEKAATEGFCERHFQATNDELRPVLLFVEEQLNKRGVSLNMQMRMAMVVEELFTNIIKYAYGKAGGKASVGLCVADDVITIRVADSGKQFDPTKYVKDVSAEKLLSDDLKGLGIVMIRRTVDSLNYKYEHGQNIVTVTKKM